VNINTNENDIMRSSRKPKKSPEYNPWEVIFKPTNGIFTSSVPPVVRNACNIKVMPTIQIKSLICLRKIATGTLDKPTRITRNKNSPTRMKIFRVAVAAKIIGISDRNFVRGSNR